MIPGPPESPTPQKARRAVLRTLPGGGGKRGPDLRPTIRNRPELHLVADEAVKALRVDEDLYQRDGALVHVVREVEPERAGVAVVTGTPQIRRMASATLRERMTRAAKWEKHDRRSDEWLPSLPGEPVVQAVAARGEWEGLRPLGGITESPAMREDGTLIQAPGYDAATGVLFVPNGDFPAVPDAPTQGDANAALAELAEVFVDFPHARPEHLSAAIAALLTVLARPAIQGSVPGFVFDANTRGSGKTLQADAVSTIATGRPAAKMSWPPDDAELEKVLAAYALRGAVLVVFDNLTTAFGGGPLDRVLTSGAKVELRVLGKSEIPQLSWRAVVLATGNNVEIVGDTSRRVLVSRLESPLESPEDRAGFVHPNLLEWVATERGRLVRAALTVLRAYVVAGRPDVGCKSWGSFESWASVVPPAIVYAGGVDPMLARVSSDRQDANHQALVAILDGWPRLAPDGITVKSAIEALYPLERLRGQAPPDGHDALREAIEVLVPTQQGRAPNTARLGHALRRFRRRVVGARMLDAAPYHAGTMRWLVVQLGSVGGDGGNGGLVPTLRGRTVMTLPGIGDENNPPSQPSPPMQDEADERSAIYEEDRW